MTTAFQLEVRLDGKTIATTPLIQGETTIGSAPVNAVRLTGKGVSARHAKLAQHRGRFIITDTSDDGTYVQGRRIQMAPITTDVEFQIGHYILRIRPISQASSAAGSSRPSPDTAASASDAHSEHLQHIVDGLVGLTQLAGIVDLQVVLETFLDRVIALLAAQRGFVVLVNSDALAAVAARPAMASLGGDGFSRTVCERVIQAQQIVLLATPGPDGDMHLIESLRQRMPQMVFGVPLIHNEVVNGVLYLEIDSFQGKDLKARKRLLSSLSALGGQILAVALERRQLIALSERWRWIAATSTEVPDLFGPCRSARMRQVQGLLTRIASEDVTALILGESGTGKEVAAQTIHRLSDRCDGPFVAVNCGAIPRDLVEGELFGYEKGAFTGANVAKPGRLELAQGGTLLLDELGELPLEAQVKLLRVLETRRFERLGGKESVAWDARVLAATNRDLQQAIDAGEFREDLYYRLNVVSVELPPLRERREDIELLVADVLITTNRRFRRKLCGVTPEALAALTAYDWPGNVRELRNVIERAFLLEASDRLTLSSLPFSAPARVAPLDVPSPSIVPLEEFVRKQEVDYINLVLDQVGGSVKEAARVLRVNRSSLHRKLRSMGIRGSDGTDDPGDDSNGVV